MKPILVGGALVALVVLSSSRKRETSTGMSTDELVDTLGQNAPKAAPTSSSVVPVVVFGAGLAAYFYWRSRK